MAKGLETLLVEIATAFGPAMTTFFNAFSKKIVNSVNDTSLKDPPIAVIGRTQLPRMYRVFKIKGLSLR